MPLHTNSHVFSTKGTHVLSRLQTSTCLQPGDTTCDCPSSRHMQCSHHTPCRALRTAASCCWASRPWAHPPWWRLGLATLPAWQRWSHRTTLARHRRPQAQQLPSQMLRLQPPARPAQVQQQQRQPLHRQVLTPWRAWKLRQAASRLRAATQQRWRQHVAAVRAPAAAAAAAAVAGQQRLLPARLS